MDARTNGGVFGEQDEPGVKSSLGALHKLSLIGKVRAGQGLGGYRLGRAIIRRDVKMWA